ncbi:hypothetical protein [Halopiger thermotolerans]
MVFPADSDSGLREIGFGLLCLASTAAIPVAQVLSLVGFDTTGFDRYVPGVVIYTVVPAALVTAVPAIVAVRVFSGERALLYSAGVLVAAGIGSSVTAQAFVLG